MAIIIAIPFGLRLLFHHDGGRWQHFGEAFYTAHFELFFGNACLGMKGRIRMCIRRKLIRLNFLVFFSSLFASSRLIHKRDIKKLRDNI